jgi:hypothetical protein
MLVRFLATSTTAAPSSTLQQQEPNKIALPKSSLTNNRTKEVAQSKYNIIDIAKHIENMRYKQINRIISSKGNERTASLLKPRHPEAIITTSTRSNFEFDIPIAKKFSNNPAIKTLKTLRDGCPDLYSNNGSSQPPKQPPTKPTRKANNDKTASKTTVTATANQKPRRQCEGCHQPFIRFGIGPGKHEGHVKRYAQIIQPNRNNII